MTNKLKHVARMFQYLFRDLFFNKDDYISLYWWNTKNNFGDILNVALIEKLTGKKALWSNPLHYNKDHYLCIGSILQRSGKYSLIWGAGFISEEATYDTRPKKVYAVRGPKTREKLLEDNIDCPEVYGDPALLMPQIYSPDIEKKYSLGFIPHLKNKTHSFFEEFQNEENILILDVQEKNPFKFIDMLLSCEKIASTSLHGIILADAYGIPSIWCEFDGESIGRSHFKFHDYFMSVNRCDRTPLIIHQYSSLDEIFSHFCDYKIDIDLSKLIQSCPFDNILTNNLE